MPYSHAVLIPLNNGTMDVFWARDRANKYPRICSSNTLAHCIRATIGVNWRYQARKVEHEIDALCPVCVSFLFRCVLVVKACHRCKQEEREQGSSEDDLAAREYALRMIRMREDEERRQLEEQQRQWEQQQRGGGSVSIQDEEEWLKDPMFNK